MEIRYLSQNRRGDIMLTWKRIFLASSILCVTVIIGWTTWYLCIVRPQLVEKPAIKINAKNTRTVDDTPDVTTAKTSQGQKFSQEDDDTTADTHVESEESVNTLPDSVSEALKQHTHHQDESHDHNHKELNAKEMEKERKYLENVKSEFNELKAKINELKKHSEKRNTEIANYLNSLSAEEQQVYFENIRSGKVLEEMPSNFFESARANLKSEKYSEEAIDEVLGSFKQEIQNFASEAGAKKHLEKLRDHGFVPKF